MFVKNSHVRSFLLVNMISFMYLHKRDTFFYIRINDETNFGWIYISMHHITVSERSLHDEKNAGMTRITRGHLPRLPLFLLLQGRVEHRSPVTFTAPSLLRHNAGTTSNMSVVSFNMYSTPASRHIFTYILRR